MTNDTDTKTVDRPYDSDKDPEAKSDTGQLPRVAVARKSTALKISLWIGIPAVGIVIILWVLHEWLGCWLIMISSRCDSPVVYKSCRFIGSNLPIWFVGKGVIKEQITSSYPYSLPGNSYIYWILFRGSASVSYFKKLLRHEDNKVKMIALHYLCYLRNEVDEIDPIIKEFLEDDDINLRIVAADTLFKFGHNSKECIPIYIKALQGQRLSLFRMNAIKALGEHGPNAIEAVPLLKKYYIEEIEKGDIVDSQLIRESIRKIRGTVKDTLTELMQILEKKGYLSPEAVAYALGDIGPDAKEAVPLLIEILKKDGEWPNRREAARALGKIDPDNEQVIEALIAAFADDNANVCEVAVEAFKNITTGKKKAIIRLIEVLRRNEQGIRLRAADAIYNIGEPVIQETVPALIQSFKKGNTDAAYALGEMGDPSALPCLQEALSKEKNPKVRSIIKIAINKLESIKKGF